MRDVAHQLKMTREAHQESLVWQHRYATENTELRKELDIANETVDKLVWRLLDTRDSFNREVLAHGETKAKLAGCLRKVELARRMTAKKAEAELAERKHLTRRMMQSLDGYWQSAAGYRSWVISERAKKGGPPWPRGRYQAEDWWMRFERYRAALTDLEARA